MVSTVPAAALNPDDPFSRFLAVAESAALDLKALPQLEEAALKAREKPAPAAQEAENEDKQQVKKTGHQDAAERVGCHSYFASITSRSILLVRLCPQFASLTRPQGS
jgi:hypothetical protein